MPSQLAVVGVQGEDAVRIEDAVGIKVVAAAILVLIIRKWISGWPEQGIRFRIVGAGQPGGTASHQRLATLPGFRARLTLSGNRPMSPNELAVLGLERGDEPANSFVGAGHANDHLAFDDEWRQGAAIVLR